jgi:hypothetical protein
MKEAPDFVAGCAAAVALLLSTALLAQEKPPHPADELTARTYAVTLVEGNLVAAATTYGLVLYEIPQTLTFQPGQPVKLSTIAEKILLPDSTSDVEWVDGVLAAANGPHGVKLFARPSDKAPFAQISEIETAGAALSLAVAGKLLFVAQGVMGVAAYDLADPASPREVLTLETDGYARAVLLPEPAISAAGGQPGEAVERGSTGGGKPEAPEMLWVANGSGGLVSFKLKADFQPGAAGKLDVTGDVRRVMALRDRLVMSRGTKGLCAVTLDLSAAGMPCVQNKDVARGLTAVGNYVLAADGGEGIMVVEWSDWTAPNVVRRFGQPDGSVNDLLVDSGRLFVAADYAGVMVWDVSDLK